LKRIFCIMTVILVLLSCLEVEGLVPNGINDTGIVPVTACTPEGDSTEYKFMVSKDGQNQFFRAPKNKEVLLPLPFGTGVYSITLLKQKLDDVFSIEKQYIVNHVSENEYIGLTCSDCVVNWHPDGDLAVTALNLTKGCMSEEEKVMVIRKFVVTTIEYDHDKIDRIPTDYLPNAEETFKTGNGLCYDYSVLFAAMLRINKIPAKVVKGYTTAVPVYHAWNEVFVDGEWKIVDTTVDSYYLRKWSRLVKAFKNAENYLPDEALIF